MNQQLLDAVIEAVTTELKVPSAQLLCDTRSSRNVAWARQVAMYTYIKFAGTNFTATGLVFDRDRTTVRHAFKKVAKQYTRDVRLAGQIRRINIHVRTAAAV